MSAGHVSRQQQRGASLASGALSYRAYGLSIRSELPLAELEPGAGVAADLTIRFHDGAVPLADLVDADPGGPVRHHFHWEGVGAFLLIGVREIIVAPAPGVSHPLLSFPLLGPIMAVNLHLRRHLVLHASALEIGGAAAIFIGDKGAGKSTTAAALLRAGHCLLSDDVVAIDFREGCAPRVLSAYPQIKLVEDAAAGITIPGAERMPAPIPDFPKEQCRLSNQFSRSHLKPRRIYQLVQGEKTQLHEVAAVGALRAVMRFAYISMVRRYPWRLDESGEHLKRSTALIRQAPVVRLEVRRGLDCIDDIVRLVEQDMAGA